MVDDEADPTDPQQVANLTFAYLRRIENQATRIMEILPRHETRLGRIERDIGEVKSDVVLLENRILSQTNDILRIVERIDEHQRQLEQARSH